MANPTAQHTVNAVIAAAPLASFWANFPQIVTVAVGCLAFIYYVLVISEKVVNFRAKWLQIHQSANRVAAKVTEDKPEIV